MFQNRRPWACAWRTDSSINSGTGWFDRASSAAARVLTLTELVDAPSGARSW